MAEAFILTGEGVRELMAAILRAGRDYRVRVRGRGFSMIPFIKDNDAVMLKPVDLRRGIKFGDVVAVSSGNKGKIVVHRIIRLKRGCCQTKGDNNLKADPWCTIAHIIGVVDEIIAGEMPYGRWLPHHLKHWQNVMIAIASRTGLLNRILYPGYLCLKKWVTS